MLAGEEVARLPSRSGPALGTQAEGESQRLLFVDNLRVVVIILVVLVHLAIVYGGLSAETANPNQPGGPGAFLLLWFSLACQAFFMGLLFLIAGYFTPGAYDRKGGAAFLRDRLLRLGIPLLVYDLLINPLIVFARTSSAASGDFLSNYPRYLTGIGTGPMWFVWNLLLFAATYALWRQFARPAPKNPENGTIAVMRLVALFVLGLAATTFVVRIWFPTVWWNIFNLRLQYYPQYAGLFIIGAVAYRRNWLAQLSAGTGRVGLAVAGAAILAFPLVLGLGDFGLLAGGLNWQALVFALWEALICAGMSLGLLALFRRSFNRQGKFGAALSANAYTVYIIHVPVIFLLGLLLHDVALPPLPAFALATVITIPLCFLISHFLVRQLPVVKRIL